MGIPEHFIFPLRNLYAGQEATIRTGHGKTDWFKTGKGVHQVCILSPCLFNLYMQSTSCEMPGWINHKLKSRLPGEISITSDMQIILPNARKQRGTKECFSMRMKTENEKAGIKFNMQKQKRLWHPIPSLHGK